MLKTQTYNRLAVYKLIKDGKESLMSNYIVIKAIEAKTTSI